MPEEVNILAGLLSGTISDDLWSSGLNSDFFNIKGCIENILSDLKINGCRYVSENPEPFLHPGKSANLFLNNDLLGYLGEVHPDVQEMMDLKIKPYLFVIYLDILLKYQDKNNIYKEISKYPAVTRDVAFLIQSGIEADHMLDIVLQQKEDLLENVSIFDIYAGKGIPAGTKSLGLRFSYRSPCNTLTDSEVNYIHEKIVHNIIDRTGSKIRGESS